MNIEGKTLDDLLYKTFSELLKLPFDNTASRSDTNGDFSEIFGVLLELKNPRARLSRSDRKGKAFSALGEFLWYLDGSDRLAFIEYYISEYKSESYNKRNIYGAYGPRFFRSRNRYNQIENVLNLLKKRSSSRRAVIQLFESRDIAPRNKANVKSIPCTCTLQFIQRNGKLNMITFMRSNDAFKGLPHDVYAFTMLHEYMSSALNLELGIYKHCVGSMHLYKSDENAAQAYINEGLQSTKDFMEEMPKGDQRGAINTLLKLEKKIRLGKKYNISDSGLSGFWQDIAYLLAFYKHFKERNVNEMKKVRKLISVTTYNADIERKIESLENTHF